MRLLTRLIIVVVFVAVPAFGQTAQIPDAPTPAPAAPIPSAMPDRVWEDIQQLPRGQWILVGLNFRQPVRCRFGGATDAYLFCTSTLDPDHSGWQFERASVTSVVANVGPGRPVNWHPGWISGAIAGGLFVGIVASRSTDAEHAARAGLIGAACTAAITAPMAFLPHDPNPWEGSYAMSRPRTMFRVHIPLKQPRLGFLPRHASPSR